MDAEVKVESVQRIRPSPLPRSQPLPARERLDAHAAVDHDVLSERERIAAAVVSGRDPAPDSDNENKRPLGLLRRQAI